MATASFKEKPIIIVELGYNDFNNIFQVLQNQLITEITYSHVLFNGKKSLDQRVAEDLNIKIYVSRDGDDAEIGIIFRNLTRNYREDRVLLEHYGLNMCNVNFAKIFESDIITAFNEREKDFDEIIKKITGDTIGLKFKLEEGVFRRE